MTSDDFDPSPFSFTDLAASASPSPAPQLRQVRDASQDLLGLQVVADTPISHLLLDDLLPALLERVQEKLGVDNAAVLLLDEAGQALTMQVVRGPEEAVAAQVRVSLGEGFAGRIAATREELVVDDVTTFPVVNPFLHEHLHSVAGVPLVTGGRLVGVLHVGTVQPRYFSAHDVQLLQQAADRMALAIDRARLYAGEQRAQQVARAHELVREDTARHMDEFLITASHDLRTPLTVVKSRVQLALRRLIRLRNSAETPPDALQESDLEAIYESLVAANQSADRLIQLIGVLFDVARAQSGTLELNLALCDLAALVQKNVAARQAAAPERRIFLSVPGEVVPVEADADRLDQVLSNYLANAVKYSPVDQPVTIRLAVVDRQAVVSVSDHGPGIPFEEQRHIWEAFHRASGSEVHGGSGPASGSLGLGLHICKQLIELHPGGSVGVESVVAEGSTFWFRLPLAS